MSLLSQAMTDVVMVRKTTVYSISEEGREIARYKTLEEAARAILKEQ